MTIQISPFLSSRLEAKNTKTTNSSHHEKIYEDLKQHANDVKPNEPKAKLVKNGPVTSAITGIGDTFNDGANFFKAVATGKMNDNNLGRINDLGMKAGALLIATFLAAHAKTKTEAIMQFVGGTTFFAAMSLWPKFFINLPARIIHGFPIDEKYISAQGDKKDLYLDNQFIPTKIHSAEQMHKEMKRMGIDPKDENAEEKWLEKRRMTALQSRGLWMATAGFATPLMTALIGNAVQPKVEDAVIKHDFKKANGILNDNNALSKHLAGKTSHVKNQAEINKLLDSYRGRSLNDGFWEKLSNLFRIDDIMQEFRNPDDKKPIKNLHKALFGDELKNVWEQTAVIQDDNLKEVLREAELPSLKLSDFFYQRGGNLSASRKMSESEISDIISRLGDKKTPENLRKVLKELNVADNTQNNIIASLKTDNENFFKMIRDFNERILPKVKGRIRAYVDLLNPVAGSKSESVYTKEYNRIISEVFDKLGIKGYKELEGIKKADGAKGTIPVLSGSVQKLVEKETQYIDEFQKFVDITEEFKNGGWQNETAFKERLKSAFGEKFPLVNGSVSGFWGNEQTGKKNITWMLEIFNKYCEEGGGPKLGYIDELGVEGISDEVKGAVAKLSDNSTLMKIFSINQDDAAFFKKIDDFTSLVQKHYNSKESKFEDLNAFKDGLKRILGKEAPIVKDEKAFNNFIKHYKPEKRDFIWTEEILTGSREYNPLLRSMLGTMDNRQHVSDILLKYLREQTDNIEYSRIRAMLCANFELRNKLGAFSAFKPEQIEAAREIIYNGGPAVRYNGAEIKNPNLAEGVINALFNDKAFGLEEAKIKGFQDKVGELKTLFNKPNNESGKLFKSNSFASQIKIYATKLYNNKSWFKKFGSMAIILVAVTLIMQGFFGNIKKAFPEDKKNGGDK